MANNFLSYLIRSSDDVRNQNIAQQQQQEAMRIQREQRIQAQQQLAEQRRLEEERRRQEAEAKARAEQEKREAEARKKQAEAEAKRAEADAKIANARKKIAEAQRGIDAGNATIKQNKSESNINFDDIVKAAKDAKKATGDYLLKGSKAQSEGWNLADVGKEVARGGANAVQGITVDAPAVLTDFLTTNAVNSAQNRYVGAIDEFGQQNYEQVMNPNYKPIDNTNYGDFFRNNAYAGIFDDIDEALQNNLTGSRAGNFLSSLGEQAPTILTGNVFGSAAGLGAMGVNVFGSSAQQALENGADINKAALYGIANAGKEVGTEMISPKIPGVDKLSFGDLLNEGFEEAVGEFIDPYTQIALQDNSSLENFTDNLGQATRQALSGETLKNALESGVSGTLSAGVLQGVSSPFNTATQIRDAVTGGSEYTREIKNIDADIDLAEQALALNPNDEGARDTLNKAREAKTISQRKYATAENLRSNDPVMAKAARMANTDIIEETANRFGAKLNKSELSDITRIANKVGARVEFTNEQIGGSDGYQLEDGTIMINANAENPALTIFAHELTHDTMGTKQYKELAETLMDMYENGDIDADVDSMLGSGLTDEQKQNELVAVLAQNVLGNEASLKRLAQNNSNALSYMAEQIKNYVTNDKQGANLAKVERAMQRAIKNADTTKLESSNAFSKDATNLDGMLEEIFGKDDAALMKSYIKSNWNDKDTRNILMDSIAHKYDSVMDDGFWNGADKQLIDAIEKEFGNKKGGTKKATAEVAENDKKLHAILEFIRKAGIDKIDSTQETIDIFKSMYGSGDASEISSAVSRLVSAYPDRNNREGKKAFRLSVIDALNEATGQNLTEEKIKAERKNQRNQQKEGQKAEPKQEETKPLEVAEPTEEPIVTDAVSRARMQSAFDEKVSKAKAEGKFTENINESPSKVKAVADTSYDNAQKEIEARREAQEQSLRQEEIDFDTDMHELARQNYEIAYGMLNGQAKVVLGDDAINYARDRFNRAYELVNKKAPTRKDLNTVEGYEKVTDKLLKKLNMSKDELDTSLFGEPVLLDLADADTETLETETSKLLEKLGMNEDEFEDYIMEQAEKEKQEMDRQEQLRKESIAREENARQYASEESAFVRQTRVNARRLRGMGAHRAATAQRLADNPPKISDTKFGKQSIKKNAGKSTEELMRQAKAEKESIRNRISDSAKTINNNSSKEDINNAFKSVQDDARKVAENTPWKTNERELGKSTRRQLGKVLKAELSTRGINAEKVTLSNEGRTYNVYKNVNAEDFRDMFEICRTFTGNGELVDVHGVHDTYDEEGNFQSIGYDKCENYLSEDGLSGFSITPDGDLISVYNLNPQGGWLRSIAPIIKEKAKTLDCYVSPKENLRAIYEKVLGFKTASVMEWNEAYDHDDIGKNHEKPPVVFMVNTEADVPVENFGKTEYDEAVEYRNKFIPKQESAIPTEEETYEATVAQENTDETQKVPETPVKTDTEISDEQKTFEKVVEQKSDYSKSNRRPKWRDENEKSVNPRGRFEERAQGRGDFHRVTNKNGENVQFEEGVPEHTPLTDEEIYARTVTQEAEQKTAKTQNVKADNIAPKDLGLNEEGFTDRFKGDGSYITIARKDSGAYLVINHSADGKTTERLGEMTGAQVKDLLKEYNLKDKPRKANAQSTQETVAETETTADEAKTQEEPKKEKEKPIKKKKDGSVEINNESAKKVREQATSDNAEDRAKAAETIKENLKENMEDVKSAEPLAEEISKTAVEAMFKDKTYNQKFYEEHKEELDKRFAEAEADGLGGDPDFDLDEGIFTEMRRGQDQENAKASYRKIKKNIKEGGTRGEHEVKHTDWVLESAKKFYDVMGTDLAEKYLLDKPVSGNTDMDQLDNSRAQYWRSQLRAEKLDFMKNNGITVEKGAYYKDGAKLDLRTGIGKQLNEYNLRDQRMLEKADKFRGRAAQSMRFDQMFMNDPSIPNDSKRSILNEQIDKENERIKTRFYRRYKNGDIKLIEHVTDAEWDAYETAEGDAKKKALESIYKRVGEQIPVTFGERVRAWRYMMMLANPLTHVRNLVGNTSMQAITDYKNLWSYAVEAGVSRTKAGKEMLAQHRKTEGGYASTKDTGGMKDFATSQYERAISSDQDVSRWGTQQGFRAYKRYLGALDGLSRFNSKLLDASDNLFTSKRFNVEFRRMANANGYTVKDGTLVDKEGKAVSQKKISEMTDTALKEAKETTFHDISHVAHLIQQLEEAHPVIGFTTGSLIPFKSTPINMAKRMYEYSPVNLLWTATKGSLDLANGKVSANEYVNSLSKGLSGTSTFALGILLSSLGMLRAGGDPDDEWAEKRYKEDIGLHQDYSLVIPKSYKEALKDKGMSDDEIKMFVSLEALNPSSSSLLLGARWHEVMNSEGLWDDDRSVLENFRRLGINSLDILGTMAQPLMDMSMMQGVQNLFEDVSYELNTSDEGETDYKNVVGAVAGSLGKTYIGQFLPTLGGAINRIADPVTRTTYSDWEDDKVFRGLVKKFPFADRMMAAATGDEDGHYLEPQINAKGEEVMQEGKSVGMRAFNNLFNPFTYKTNKSTKSDRKLLELYEKTGNENIIPFNFKSAKLNGEKQTFTPKGRTQVNKAALGGYQKEINAMIENGVWDTNSPDFTSNLLDKVKYHETKNAEADYFNEAGMDGDSLLSRQDITANFLKDKGVNAYETFDILSIGNDVDEKGESIKNSGALRKLIDYHNLGVLDDIRSDIEAHKKDSQYAYNYYGLNKTVLGWNDEKVNYEWSALMNNTATGRVSSLNPDKPKKGEETPTSSETGTGTGGGKNSGKTSGKNSSKKSSSSSTDDEMLKLYEKIIKGEISATKSAVSKLKTKLDLDQSDYDKIMSNHKSKLKDLDLWGMN